MQFKCFHTWDDESGRESWTGEIEKLVSFPGHYEFQIRSRSAFCVIVGKFTFGLFACIPAYQAGCCLSSLNDVFYNRENLIEAMDNVVDAVTVAYALKALSGRILTD
jgi:hypothetical protein